LKKEHTFDKLKIKGANSMRQLLQESYSSKRPVEIIYMDDKGCLTQRFIIVYKIYPQSVKAWCLLRNEKRTFKIENILSCGFSNKRKSSFRQKAHSI
jgi:predicted DNA-binding transcriptional regulator YafY